MFDAVRFDDQIYYQSSLIKYCDGVEHAFSTRTGGVSPSPYSGLNLGLSVGDDEANVQTNRHLFFRALQVDLKQMASGEQVHDNRIQIIDAPGHFSGTDGLISNQKNIVLVIKTADCAPVLFYDPEQRVIAAVHAGWRSIQQNILTNAVNLLVNQFKCRPDDILCAVGPSIQACCYEVKQDVANRFPEPVIIRRKDRLFLDLPALIRKQLLDMQIPEKNIDSSNLCSCCNKDKFYSYRRDGIQTGRMMMAVYLV